MLEDKFAAGRPAYDKVGVELVDDVVPYELMKLRLLNASHQGLCYFGYLAGHRLVHDVMADQRFADFLLAYMEQEGTPSLRPLPGVDLDAYRHQLIARFGNAAIKDTVARLCAESSDRIPKWLLPVVRENLESGNAPVTLSAAIVASWARYAEGVDEQGQDININDRMADRLKEKQRQRTARTSWRSSATAKSSATSWITRSSPPHTPMRCAACMRLALKPPWISCLRASTAQAKSVHS